jgi:hypothetical protein
MHISVRGIAKDIPFEAQPGGWALLTMSALR